LNEDGQAAPPPGAFTQVSAGATHTCGLRTNSYWTCWGSNEYGQLNGYRITLPLLPRAY
jgi:alpha-tubulin suppressor-like RCC1 family protein